MVQLNCTSKLVRYSSCPTDVKLQDGKQFSVLTVAAREEMFYLTTHSTNFIYGYVVSDISNILNAYTVLIMSDIVKSIFRVNRGIAGGWTGLTMPKGHKGPGPPNHNDTIGLGGPSLFLVHGSPRVLLCR